MIGGNNNLPRAQPPPPPPPPSALRIKQRRRFNELGFRPEDLVDVGLADDGAYNSDDDDEYREDDGLGDLDYRNNRIDREDDVRRLPSRRRHNHLRPPSPPSSNSSSNNSSSNNNSSAASARRRRSGSSNSRAPTNAGTGRANRANRRPSPVPSIRDEKSPPPSKRRRPVESKRTADPRAAECARRIKEARERLDKVQRAFRNQKSNFL